jgi:hypothetical protein
MFNVLSNPSRQLLSLRPIDEKWYCVKQDDTVFYHADGIVYKAIFYARTQPYSLLVYEDKAIEAVFEYDLNLPVNEMLHIVIGKGKPKPISYAYISRLRANKLPWVMVDINNGAISVQCGMRWLPNLSFQTVATLNDDLPRAIEQYGLKTWQQQLINLKKQVKTRQKYQEGDIFCINTGPNQYVYCLLIASLMHLRKTPLLETLPDTHYIKAWPTIPIVYRQFDFVSPNNDLSLEDIQQHKLLAAAYCMDDALMRGEFKIIHHRDLTAEDVDFPISFSIYKRHEQGGYATAAGMDITCDLERNRQILACYQTQKANVWLTLAWGMAYFQWPLTNYLQHHEDDVNFQPHAGMGFGFSGTDPHGQYLAYNALNAFGRDKLAALFTRFEIDCALDFDAFNQQFSGLSRQAYIDFIQSN